MEGRKLWKNVMVLLLIVIMAGRLFQPLQAAEERYGIWCPICVKWQDHFIGELAGKERNFSGGISCADCKNKLLFIGIKIGEAHYSSDTDEETSSWWSDYYVQKANTEVVFPTAEAHEEGGSDEDSSYRVIAEGDIFPNTSGYGWTTSDVYEQATDVLSPFLQSTYKLVEKSSDGSFTWNDWYQYGMMTTSAGVKKSSFITYLSLFGLRAVLQEELVKTELSVAGDAAVQFFRNGELVSGELKAGDRVEVTPVKRAGREYADYILNGAAADVFWDAAANKLSFTMTGGAVSVQVFFRELQGLEVELNQSFYDTYQKAPYWDGTSFKLDGNPPITVENHMLNVCAVLRHTGTGQTERRALGAFSVEDGSRVIQLGENVIRVKADALGDGYMMEGSCILRADSVALDELMASAGSTNYTELKNYVAGLTQRIAECEAAITSLSDSSNLTQEQKVEAERKLSAALSELEQIKGRLSEAEGQLSAQAGQLASKEEELSGLSGELEKRQGEILALSEQLSGKEKELAAGREELERSKEQLSLSEAELSEKEEQLLAKEEELALNKAELLAKAEELETSREQLETSREQLSESEGQLAAAKEHLEAAEAELSGMGEKLKEMQEFVRELTGAEQTDKGIVETLKEKFEELERNEEGLVQELDRAKEESGRLEEVNGRLNTEKEALQRELEVMKEELEKMSGDRESLKEELSEKSDVLSREKEELLREIALLKSSNEDFSRQLEYTIQEQQTLIREYEQLKKKYDLQSSTKEGKEQEYLQRLALLEKQIEELEAEKSALSGQLAKKEAEKAELTGKWKQEEADKQALAEKWKQEKAELSGLLEAERQKVSQAQMEKEANAQKGELAGKEGNAEKEGIAERETVIRIEAVTELQNPSRTEESEAFSQTGLPETETLSMAEQVTMGATQEHWSREEQETAGQVTAAETEEWRLTQESEREVGKQGFSVGTVRKIVPGMVVILVSMLLGGVVLYFALERREGGLEGLLKDC